ncbi:hypothetical protein OAD66_06170 [Bacteroidia bacterium]|nr:hypothetical protein [Bacteroidia bacterium]MDB9882704.1 hypothetical protein [Bacteroidia bacterium]
MIFKTNNEYFYYSLSWQFGKVYRTRSLIRQIIDWMTGLQTPIKTSELDYRELISFKTINTILNEIYP